MSQRISAIQIPSEISPSMEIFYIPNLSVTIPTKLLSDEGEKNYITKIFTGEGSAQGNLGSTGSNVVIKNPGHHSLPMKLVKAITFCGTSYEG